MDQIVLGNVRLDGAVIINPQDEPFVCQRLERLRCPIFSSSTAMFEALSGKIDLCLIPTGIQFHREMTEAALKAGAHVLVEKPMAATLEEVDGMLQAEREHNRFIAVGFQDIYMPENQMIKGLLLDGIIGKIEKITITGLWPRTKAYYNRNHWAGKIKSGEAVIYDSPVNNAMAHFVNLSLWWAGSAFEKSAKPIDIDLDLIRAQAIENFDTCAFRLHTKEGVEIYYYGSHSSETESHPEIRIQGTLGNVRWVHNGGWEIQGKSQGTLTPAIEMRLTMFDDIVTKMDHPDQFVCSGV
jgi:predicted dehydrogenase